MTKPGFAGECRLTPIQQRCRAPPISPVSRFPDLFHRMHIMTKFECRPRRNDSARSVWLAREHSRVAPRRRLPTAALVACKSPRVLRPTHHSRSCRASTVPAAIGRVDMLAGRGTCQKQVFSTFACRGRSLLLWSSREMPHDVLPPLLVRFGVYPRAQARVGFGRKSGSLRGFDKRREQDSNSVSEASYLRTWRLWISVVVLSAVEGSFGFQLRQAHRIVRPPPNLHKPPPAEIGTG